jgi:odorant receptor
MNSIEDFFIQQTRIFGLFGLKVTKFSREPKRWNLIFRWFSIFCEVLIVLQALIFTFLHITETEIFLDLTFDISCAGFGCLSLLRVFMIVIYKKEILSEVIDMLEALFPKTNWEQKKYSVRKYLKILNFQCWIYIILMFLFFAFFNFTEILISIYKTFSMGNYVPNYSYFLWFPFGYDGKSPVVFEVFYSFSVICAFAVVFNSLAVDLLFCSILTILCMEFDILAKRFEHFGIERSKKDLIELIDEHCQLIR